MEVRFSATRTHPELFEPSEAFDIFDQLDPVLGDIQSLDFDILLEILNLFDAIFG
jgi:hypothetical protein